jgi:hypothetical protein
LILPGAKSFAGKKLKAVQETDALELIQKAPSLPSVNNCE